MICRILTLIGVLGSMAHSEVISIRVSPDIAKSPRVQYGVARLIAAIESVGERAEKVDGIGGKPRQLVVAVDPTNLKPEGFSISAERDRFSILGHDESGVLYGCLEFANRIRAQKKLAADFHFVDAPQFVLRGPCIGMQKTFILPGRKVYEYPYTPELFPFFYDKQHWTEYLDRLADWRMNTLFLWNGQPFASLVRVAEYPYANEVDDAQLKQNQEMYHWIAAEADKRGIWVVQNFYSIILPKPFAEKHGFETQLSKPNDLAADYTRKSIAQFVKEFPNVGIMPCLGEALLGVDAQTAWLTDVILPGIHDGMKLAGIEKEPPVILRTHATDATKVMPAALKVYRNLYTEAKFNGESLTTHEPRGVRQKLHQSMSELGSTHLINVHILANLEPFRFGSQRFIKKCVIAGRDRLGARGLHLYPLAYWDWPIAPDVAPLKQIDRDWIWFDAWARYSWNPDIDEATDRSYWVGKLTEQFGDSRAAEKILDALNDAGECAPRLLRRYGITEGNRQTMSLGMTLDELVHPEKYRAFPELWESQSPPGERLREFVEREVANQPHEGETPVSINAEVLEFAAKAQAAIDAATPFVTNDRAEFDRIRNDVACIDAMTKSYVAKTEAAIHLIRYELTKSIDELPRAEARLARSLEHFRELERLTRDTYRYANTMQTGQRKIPVSGGTDGKPANYHWSQLLPLYEAELADFRKRVAAIQSGKSETDESAIKRLSAAEFRVLSEKAQRYEVAVGAVVFADRSAVIHSLAPELAGLHGIRFNHKDAVGEAPDVEFECSEPVRVLVGYVKDKGEDWLKVPDLETDALADERGGAEPVLLNVASIEGLAAIDIHAFKFPAGKNTLDMRGRGSYVVLGVVKDQPIAKRDCGRDGGLRK